MTQRLVLSALGLLGSVGCGAPSSDPSAISVASVDVPVPTVSPSSIPARSPESEEDPCVTAVLWGPVDNCREFQLLIRDHCMTTSYALYFGACSLPGRIDLSGLEGFREIDGGWVAGDEWDGEIVEPTAVRGSLKRSRTRTHHKVTFDLEIEFVVDGGRMTRTMQGRTEAITEEYAAQLRTQ